MTQMEMPGDFVASLAPDTLGAWAPPLVMGVVGDAQVFGIVAAGLGESHMSVPGHALRVATATITGLTKPGGGQYAERLREAHQRWGVSPELIARVWQWGTVFIARADALTNGAEIAHARAGILLHASQTHGRHINADADVVRQPLSLDQEQVEAHFRGIMSAPASAVAAFWEVADHPKIRELLPADIDDAGVLAHCRQFLPASFVALFAR
jgi:hypothetical protein